MFFSPTIKKRAWALVVTFKKVMLLLNIVLEKVIGVNNAPGAFSWMATFVSGTKLIGRASTPH